MTLNVYVAITTTEFGIAKLLTEANKGEMPKGVHCFPIKLFSSTSESIEVVVNGDSNTVKKGLKEVMERVDQYCNGNYRAVARFYTYTEYGVVRKERLYCTKNKVKKRNLKILDLSPIVLSHLGGSAVAAA